MILQGNAGGFFDNGKQIGGCFEWSIRGVTPPVETHSGLAAVKTITFIDIVRYWISENLPLRFDVKLFGKQSGKIVAMEGQVTHTIKEDLAFDTFVKIPLELKAIESLIYRGDNDAIPQKNSEPAAGRR